jgi:Leucine-rich repeat (LRR) protein
MPVMLLLALPYAALCIDWSCSNQFTIGSPITSYFDGLSSLVSLVMSSNKLAGGLPQLNGTANLIKIDLSNNAFTGVLPATWSALTKVQNLFLQHNALRSPNDLVLQAMTGLLTLDMSYNQLTSVVSDPSQTGIASALIAFSIPFGLQNLNLAYNNITGPWTTGFFTLKRSVINLNVGGNQITSFPQDIFVRRFPCPAVQQL